MGLENEVTPAEAAGIKVEGENKWLPIIQNAAYDKPDIRRGRIGK